MINVTPLKEDHIPDIVKIHSISLKSDFLPSLGNNFLTTLYKSVLKNEDVYGFVTIDQKKIVGFIIGTKNMKKYFSSIFKSNFLKLSFYLSIKLIQKPFLLKNVIETFSYSSKDIGPPAELIVIAVLKKYQNKGIGRMLVEAIEKRFKSEKIKNYKLTVHADKKAVYFYEKLGYHRLSQFNLYNKLWYIYEKKLKGLKG